MSYVPLGYDAINAYAGTYHPSTMKSSANVAEVNFYERTLYERVASNIVFKCPDTWNQAYLKYVLMCLGYIAIIDTAEFGVIPQWCTLLGVGVYYQPTHVNVLNNLIQKSNLLIGRDCALIKFTPGYYGIWDTIHHYAEKLAFASSAVDINLADSKVGRLFGVNNKANAETLKKLLDRLNKGDTSAVFDVGLMKNAGATPDEAPWYEWQRDVQKSYIVTALLNDMQTIMNDFDSEIGIPNTNINKRERLISDEVNSNNAETMARIYTWLDAMEPGIKMANELFPNINLSVTTRWKEGGASGENNTDRYA